MGAMTPIASGEGKVILGTIWPVLGWSAWCIITIVALGWVVGCRDYIRKGTANSLTLMQAMFLCIVPVAFLLGGWNKLHILWVAPVAVTSVYLLACIPGLNRLLAFMTFVFAAIISGGRFPRNRLNRDNEKGDVEHRDDEEEQGK